MTTKKAAPKPKPPVEPLPELPPVVVHPRGDCACCGNPIVGERCEVCGNTVRR